MINRKEEIKKKGFSIALESDTRATQSPFENVDFSKIKVGAKTFDDAIYTLGDLKKIDRTLADKKEVLDGLKNAAGFVRHVIAEQMDMRKTPEIAFYYDEAIERAKRIEELLEQIK